MICNTPILLIFFNRPESFEKVFKIIESVQPRKLFLAQDGPRNGVPEDIENIERCRKIASNITWECDSLINYSNINLGCGKRPATAISWAFEHTDKLIIIEDDCLASLSFFQYCDELLEKYQDDDRISYISGLNHFEEWDCGDKSYFFTKTGAIWGWATWKRSWSRYDYYVEEIQEPYLKKLIELQFTNIKNAKERIECWYKASNSKNDNNKLTYWDIQWGFVKYSQNQLVIVPKYNQICNIGIGEKSTHAQGIVDKKYIKGKNFVFIPMRELEFPIKHPSHMICDINYDNNVYKISRGSIILRIKVFIYRLFMNGNNNDSL